MEKKEMTNEELARMIVEGFANTSTKQDIQALDERLTIVERKLDKALYREFQRVDKREEWAKKVGIRLDT